MKLLSILIVALSYQVSFAKNFKLDFKKQTQQFVLNEATPGSEGEQVDPIRYAPAKLHVSLQTEVYTNYDDSRVESASEVCIKEFNVPVFELSEDSSYSDVAQASCSKTVDGTEVNFMVVGLMGYIDYDLTGGSDLTRYKVSSFSPLVMKSTGKMETQVSTFITKDIGLTSFIQLGYISLDRSESCEGEKCIITEKWVNFIIDVTDK